MKQSLLERLGVAPIARLIELNWIAFSTWRMHPLSPTMPRVILRRNHLTRSL